MGFSLNKISLTISGKTILSNLDLNIKQGSFLAVLGPSGGGKSSLLRLLNGLQSPTDGSITYNGQNLSDFEPIDLRKKVGLVFQTPVMVPGTVRENLTLPYRWNKKTLLPNDDILTKNLELVGLDSTFLNRESRDLSGGEKQRVSLARTLLNKPEVLLLDEPTSGLDPAMASRIINRIEKLHSNLNLTTILVSHQHDLVKKVANEVIFIIGGKIVESGRVDIIDSPSSEQARIFMEEEEE